MDKHTVTAFRDNQRGTGWFYHIELANDQGSFQSTNCWHYKADAIASGRQAAKEIES